MGPHAVGPHTPGAGRPRGYFLPEIILAMRIARGTFPHKLGQNVPVATITEHKNFLLSLKGSAPAAVDIQFTGIPVKLIVTSDNNKTPMVFTIKKAGEVSKGRYEYMLQHSHAHHLPLLEGKPIPIVEKVKEKWNEAGAVVVAMKDRKDVFRVMVLLEDINININIERAADQLDESRFQEIFAKSHKRLQEIMQGSLYPGNNFTQAPVVMEIQSLNDPKSKVPVEGITAFMSKKDGSISDNVPADSRGDHFELQLYLLYKESEGRSILCGKILDQRAPDNYKKLFEYYLKNFRDIHDMPSEGSK